ncbi:hypothetical protein Ddye_014235 [Dipteronia dyeriana]|uniref:Uncharacterized protein n=1 Tax=Dipteronia dyeriana TaxID=168575 RepID=A0AAD9X7R1_9ROSI|nr:hypothetical protein Ddye_014235 [Dipteronia dyeriana]
MLGDQFEGYGWDREFDALFISYVYCHSFSSRNVTRDQGRSKWNETGWGAVVLAEAIALIAASTVHRVCITV